MVRIVVMDHQAQGTPIVTPPPAVSPLQGCGRPRALLWRDASDDRAVPFDLAVLIAPRFCPPGFPRERENLKGLHLHAVYMAASPPQKDAPDPHTARNFGSSGAGVGGMSLSKSEKYPKKGLPYQRRYTPAQEAAVNGGNG